MESRPTIPKVHRKDNLASVRNGGPNDAEQLASLLSESFAQDPMFNWIFPRKQLYRAYFHLLIQEVYLPVGMIHTDTQMRATALWLPPQQRFQVAPTLSLLKLAWELVYHEGLKPLGRIRQQGRIFARHLPREPHYYLQFIGASCSHQGQGLGSTLLSYGTQICDEQAMPAYLESSNLRNVPLYERHGFKVIAKEQLPGQGPTIYFMWRDAQ